MRAHNLDWRAHNLDWRAHNLDCRANPNACANPNRVRTTPNRVANRDRGAGTSRLASARADWRARAVFGELVSGRSLGWL